MPKYFPLLSPACACSLIQVKTCDKYQTTVSYLYPAVSPVGHNDVAIGIHSHPGGGVELAVAFTMRAKLKQELSISAVHLEEVWG